MLKAHKLKMQALQKEQYQLVKIEKILQDLLGKVNENLNELKVEELQLKSSLIEDLLSSRTNDDDQPTTSAQAVARSKTTTIDVEDDGKLNQEGIENINKQMLALESLLVPLQKNSSNYEEDDDDDVDIDNEEEFQTIVKHDQDDTEDDDFD